MESNETKEDPSVSPEVVAQVSNILRPTLQDNDFLQSFVRIGLEDGAENGGADPTKGRRHSMRSDQPSRSDFCYDNYRRRSRDPRGDNNRSSKLSLESEIEIDKTRKRRKRRSAVVLRLEEVYTDKDRAAAVNMGSRDIKQSLKLKRKQDRSEALQIPEEAEPSAMLALGAREMRIGDVNVAISLINKALELSPNDKSALIARSRCHLLLGDPQKALEDAESALRGKCKSPNNAKAIYCKAEALYHLGDFEMSLVYYYRGMKLRPEFDQFRLGVQKAKEAIQNILGDHGLPLSLEAIQPYLADPGEANVDSSKKSPKVSVSVSETFDSSSNVGSDQGSSKRSVTSGKNSGPNLLGRLNVDKKYLQSLLRRPDVKAAHQESASHITVHAEEGIAFLKNRQEFWRQQRAAKNQRTKRKLNT